MQNCQNQGLRELKVFKINSLFIINQIQAGNMFGEVEFFSNKQREFTTKTIDVTNLTYLEKEDFLETIKNF